MSQQNDIPESSRGYSIKPILQQLKSQDDASFRARETCLHSLFLTDPQRDREAILNVKGAITSGTCSWILSTPEYEQWERMSSDATNPLWIYGGPGSGKTMLSVFLTKHLEGSPIMQDAAHCRSESRPLVLYFFCDGSEESRSSEVAILRGLLLQAIRQRPSLLGHLQQAYEEEGDDLFQHWSFDLLWVILRNFILEATLIETPGLSVEHSPDRQNQGAYILVDGLDECESASIRRLVQKLSKFRDDAEIRERAKVMIISREQPALRAAFAGHHLQLNLDEPHNAKAVRADVQRHILRQVDTIAGPGRKNYSEELRKSVEDLLCQNTRANFLWVSLVMTELEATSRIEAWEHLSRLPPTLDAMYEWMIMQIPHELRDYSTKILLWVTLAYRPLSIAELVVALDERHLGLTDAKTVRDCVSHCGRIIRTAGDEKVHLVHRSARQYLLERLESSPSFFKDCVELNPFNLKEGHKLIASICIESLTGTTRSRIRDSHGQIQGHEEALSRDTLNSSTPTALSDYARAFWARHVRNAEDLMLEIVDGNAQIFEEHSSMRGVLAYEGSKGLLTEDIPILHFAAYHGFTPVVKRLLKKRWWNKLKTRRLAGLTDHLGRTPLHLAVYRPDNGPIVELLLKRGADAFSKDNAGATAFDYATKYGTTEILSVSLLGSNKTAR